MRLALLLLAIVVVGTAFTAVSAARQRLQQESVCRERHGHSCCHPCRRSSS